MKKKSVICGAFIAMCSVSLFMGMNKSSEDISRISLNEVEALAICEVSANAALNIGYCTKLVNSNIETCVEEGAPSCVRCSGTILVKEKE